ncbi:hypothetical protein FOCC_FOCC004878 [Frankliniella occidentalis]|nr:hypothetical protein FOCC_FOCC004878 [Frankliniella occidentalis]
MATTTGAGIAISVTPGQMNAMKNRGNNQPRGEKMIKGELGKKKRNVLVVGRRGVAKRPKPRRKSHGTQAGRTGVCEQGAHLHLGQLRVPGQLLVESLECPEEGFYFADGDHIETIIVQSSGAVQRTRRNLPLMRFSLCQRRGRSLPYPVVRALLLALAVEHKRLDGVHAEVRRAEASRQLGHGLPELVTVRVRPAHHHEAAPLEALQHGDQRLRALHGLDQVAAVDGGHGDHGLRQRVAHLQKFSNPPVITIPARVHKSRSRSSGSQEDERRLSAHAEGMPDIGLFWSHSSYSWVDSRWSRGRDLTRAQRRSRAQHGEEDEAGHQWGLRHQEQGAHIVQAVQGQDDYRVGGVQDVRLDKRTPCERLLLSSWEQRHCCALPDDLRQFYLSSDGFSLTWNYQNAGQLIPLGHMRVNAITELRRLAGVKSLVDADSPTLLDVEICRQAAASGAGQAPGPSCTERPNFGVKCKIFELDPCQGMAKVCLVYLDKGLEPRRPEPRIWLLDRCFEWHFLASDFTTYFRMMLVHQGLPLWQFRGTPMGLTPWAEVPTTDCLCTDGQSRPPSRASPPTQSLIALLLQQMLTLIAPHLLLNQPDSSAHALHTMEWADAPYSHLDPTIFKTRSKVKKK